MAQGTETNENGVAYVTPQYVLRQQLSELVTTHGDKWTQTPDRARKSRELTNGDMQAPIPENFKIAGADKFRVDSPHKYLVSYHQRNQQSKNPPRVKRWRRSDSDEDRIESTKVEQIMQAVMDDRYKFRDSVDIILMESVCISVNTPATEALSRVPSLWEKDGKTIKPRYARNAAGKPKAKGDKTWRASTKASKKIHDADVRDALSKKIPTENELLGPTAFIPVFGPNLVLDAVVIERTWTVTEIMRRQLVIEGLSGHLSPDGSAQDGSTAMANTGGGGVKITELHAVDYQEDGPHPYIAYMADTGKGRAPIRKIDKRSGELVDHIVDLRKEYGLTQFHVALSWGQNWAHPDYDKKGMPFPLPFAQSWLAIDAILTGATVWSWWRGFPTLIEQPTANTPPEIETLADSPDDNDDATEIQPLSIIRAKGTVTELGTQGPAAVIQWLVTFLVGANREQAPTSGVDSDASSGFQASLQMAYGEDAMADVRDGTIALYKQTASIQAELLAGIAERYCDGKRLPIQRITPVPLGSRTRDGTRKRDILDLTPDMFGDMFDMDADFPPQPNLAKGQQWAEWVELGLVLLEEFREEIIGDPNPEIFIARRLKQRIMDSPEYMQKIVALVAQLEGNEQERQQLVALASGQAEQGTDGVIRPAVMAPPAAPMLPGAPASPTGAGGLGSPTQSALAGAVGGPVGAAQQAMAAGGAVPPNVQLGT